jgi:hypothetical protein
MWIKITEVKYSLTCDNGPECDGHLSILHLSVGGRHLKTDYLNVYTHNNLKLQ